MPKLKYIYGNYKEVTDAFNIPDYFKKREYSQSGYEDVIGKDK